MNVLRFLASVLVLSPVVAIGASVPPPQTGPVIDQFGPVYPVPDGSFNLLPDTRYRVIMDVAERNPDASQPNRSLVSAARFLNMHARNGIHPKDIDFAIIVHGKAAMDLLSNDAYVQRFGQSNPNAELLASLGSAGVTIYLCGQTAAHMGIAPDALHPAVSLALSAMTAHVRLQAEGYSLIPF